MIEEKGKQLLRQLQEAKLDPVLRKEIEQCLEDASRDVDDRRRELGALMQGAKAVLQTKGFKEAARAIFDYCKSLLGATSGYVALLSDDGHENEVLFLEAGGLPCTVDPALPMPIRGLRAEAYAQCKAVYDNDFMKGQWARFMPKGHVVLKNVLFAPLIIDGKTVGIIGLANKEGGFDAHDALMASGFGELAAIALKNSRDVDLRNEAEKQREEIIRKLQDALSHIKQLTGLLPICSHCKKIRDEAGLWSQLESYVRKHSQAEFSHSICPQCAKIYYPDLKIYED